jgi:hypothetical protein
MRLIKVPIAMTTARGSRANERNIDAIHPKVETTSRI